MDSNFMKIMSEVSETKKDLRQL